MEKPLTPNEVSLIVSVYKDTEALAVVVQALMAQSVSGFEVIISEDGDCPQMRDAVVNLPFPRLLHCHQEDLGWRKNRALNRAIRAASGRYLIFIDGDCVPFKCFVEGHLALAQPGVALAGRRVDLGREYSDKLRSGQLTVAQLERNYLRDLIPLHRDGIRHYEDGLSLNPKRPAFKILSRFKGNPDIYGCNFSCYKKDLEDINGFDEDYTQPTFGEDCDLVWRFSKIGVCTKTCRHVASIIHLYHKKNFSQEIYDSNNDLMRSKISADRFFCENGLVKS